MTFWQELKMCKSGRGQRRFSIPWFPLSSWLGHLLHKFNSGEKEKQCKSQLQGEVDKISQLFMVSFVFAGFQVASLVNTIKRDQQGISRDHQQRHWITLLRNYPLRFQEIIEGLDCGIDVPLMEGSTTRCLPTQQHWSRPSCSQAAEKAASRFSSTAWPQCHGFSRVIFWGPWFLEKMRSVDCPRVQNVYHWLLGPGTSRSTPFSRAV